MPVDVLCIGHAAYDISVFVEGFPPEDSKSETTELLEGGGGPAANAAYLLSLWGISCAFGGLLGTDKYGQKIRDEFNSVGTDVSLLEMRAGHVTPVSVIVINKQNGSRTIVNRKSKAGDFGLDPQRLAKMSPEVLLFDGHELEASLQALKTFPNVLSILDAGSWREGTVQLAPRVRHLAASERFALQATGLSELKTEAAQKLCVEKLRQFSPNAIITITLGERGLIAFDERGFYSLAAYPARTVDTTGAGDIFHGAFAYALLKEMAFHQSLRFASMTASLSVRAAGGRQSIPSLAQVQEVLKHVD
jgi:sulfofructose kinase